MAASFPAMGNNTTDAPLITTSPTINTTNASRNHRGLNRPKCIKCGNVARSRCPYQSCKSCCAKAQNPCLIHVLKGNSTLPDKSPSTRSPLFDLQSTDVFPSANSHKVASLRQLSSNFAQFNNLQRPLCSRKPLTRKEAGEINGWRYTKVKEYKDKNIEAENKAFDWYMQIVNLLEEVFTVKGPVTDDGSPTSNPNPNSSKDGSEMVIQLRSHPTTAENLRNRMQKIDGAIGLDDQELFRKPKKKKSWRDERVDALTDLMDKLNKVQNEDDLKSCSQMKTQVFKQHNKTSQLESKDIETLEDSLALQNDVSFKPQSNYSLPKWLSTSAIDQDALDGMDAHFATLEEIEDI